MKRLHNIQILDILHKIEVLYNNMKKKPLVRVQKPPLLLAKHVLNTHEHPTEANRILVDYCYHLRIFKTHPPTRSILSARERYHFETAYDTKMKQLTKKNIIKAFEYTSVKQSVSSFLNKHAVHTRNQISNRFLIIELLEHIECGMLPYDQEL